MASEPEIILEIDASRVEIREGEPYLYLDRADFDQVPRETLVHWYERGDENPAAEIPFTVKLIGDVAGRLPHGKDLRMVMPKGEDKIASAVRRSGIDLIAGDQLVRFRGARERSDFRERGEPRWTMVQDEKPLALGFETTPPETLGILPPRVRGVHVTTPRDKRPGHEIQPTLSDALMFEKRAFAPGVPHKLQEAIKQAHRTSRAFVFDRAASYRVGEICSYEPDLIAEQQEFARVPYPRTFIELDVDALLSAIEDAGLAVRRDTMLTKDERLGFLITDRGIYTAADGAFDDKPGSKPMWSPVIYRPHQPMTHEQEQRASHEFGVSRMVLDEFFWGSGYELLSPSQRRSLRAQHGLDWMIPAGEQGRLATMLAGGGTGDLKVAICAMLLLIRPSLLKTVETREPGRKLVMGRPTTFIAHSVVTIRLTADQTVRKIRRACKEEAGRARARWHEVRGHYMHNHAAKTSGCTHDWQQIDDNHWECRRGCKGKRAWRTYPDGRGDASVGVVTKHYAVKR
jgi:hypothetical protein